MLDNGYSACSFSHYLEMNFILALLVAFLFWWITLPALLMPPLVGLGLGYFKSRDDPSEQPLSITGASSV